jgi:AraC family transcriptional regulator, melibiose operon regulatory protein
MEKEEFSEFASWTTPSHSFFVERHVATAMSTAHWHDHVELNLLLDGRMTYLYNGRQEQVEAGQLVLFWAAIPHQTIVVTPDAPLICIYLPLADFLGLPLEQLTRQAIMQGAFVKGRSTVGGTTSLASQWVEEWETGGELRRQLVCDEVKLAVRRLMLDEATNPTAAGSMGGGQTQSVRHAQLVTEMINQRFADALTLTSLSNLAGMHPATANRAFRDVMGMSAMEYLTRYRLARAMQRLAETDDGVLEIALDCGFGSNSRFYEIFRQRTGTTPRQFRQSLR